MNELRKDRRAPASLKVKYKSATVADFIEQFGADVSRGGIFIKTKKPLDTGALLKFEFQLQGGVAVIHGVGRVAWRRLEEKARPDLPAGMGIKFIKLDDESRSVIDRIEERHGAGSRFEQTDHAELAKPLSSLPPGPALNGIASPPPQASAARAAGGSEPKPKPEQPSFRPPPPAISSIPPALADAWPAVPSGKPQERTAHAAAPKGALGSFFPNGGARKAPPSVRSTARDTSEFLASAFSVGGAGQEVRSQARVQVEQARRDPQSVDLANELFGDLSEPTQSSKRAANAQSEPAQLPELEPSGAHKPASPQERSLADKIPSIEELVNEVTGAGTTPAFQSAVSLPAAPPGALSSPPVTHTLPLSLALSTPPTAADTNAETLRPPVAAPQRSVMPMVLGGLLFVAVAAGVFIVVRAPHKASAPLTASTAAPSPTAPEPATAPAAAPAEPAPAAPTAAAPVAAKPVPVEVSVTSEPRAAQVFLDGKPSGTTPATLSLMTAVPVEISVRSPGYGSKTQRLTPEVGMGPQHFDLVPLPFELVINTDPPGATVHANDVSALSPAPLALGHLDGLITASVEKDGYQRMSRTVRLEEFREDGGTMRATVTLSLSPLPSAGHRRPNRAPPTAAPPEPSNATNTQNAQSAPPVVLVKPEPASEAPAAAEAMPAKATPAAPEVPPKAEPAPKAPTEAPPTQPAP